MRKKTCAFLFFLYFCNGFKLIFYQIATIRRKLKNASRFVIRVFQNLILFYCCFFDKYFKINYFFL